MYSNLTKLLLLYSWKKRRKIVTMSVHVMFYPRCSQTHLNTQRSASKVLLTNTEMVNDEC